MAQRRQYTISNLVAANLGELRRRTFRSDVGEMHTHFLDLVECEIEILRLLNLEE